MICRPAPRSQIDYPTKGFYYIYPLAMWALPHQVGIIIGRSAEGFFSFHALRVLGKTGVGCNAVEYTYGILPCVHCDIWSCHSVPMAYDRYTMATAAQRKKKEINWASTRTPLNIVKRCGDRGRLQSFSQVPNAWDCLQAPRQTAPMDSSSSEGASR